MPSPCLEARKLFNRTIEAFPRAETDAPPPSASTDKPLKRRLPRYDICKGEMRRDRWFFRSRMEILLVKAHVLFQKERSVRRLVTWDALLGPRSGGAPHDRVGWSSSLMRAERRVGVEHAYGKARARWLHRSRTLTRVYAPRCSSADCLPPADSGLVPRGSSPSASSDPRRPVSGDRRRR
ncbi:hypothetical protein KM043_004312 [Ampulex compressa]|nr:hypothetical protein KM043_004312 [Ampulex compressa]